MQRVNNIVILHYSCVVSLNFTTKFQCCWAFLLVNALTKILPRKLFEINTILLTTYNNKIPVEVFCIVAKYYIWLFISNNLYKLINGIQFIPFLFFNCRTSNCDNLFITFIGSDTNLRNMVLARVQALCLQVEGHSFKVIIVIIAFKESFTSLNHKLLSWLQIHKLL